MLFDHPNFFLIGYNTLKYTVSVQLNILICENTCVVITVGNKMNIESAQGAPNLFLPSH